jgi:hypothetical protein
MLPKLCLHWYDCQNALNDISTRCTVGLCWVSGHAVVRRNEIAYKFARGGSVQKFKGRELSEGICTLSIKVDNWQCGVVLVVLRDRLED